MKVAWRIFFLLSAGVVLPSGYWCAGSALETQGEVMQGVCQALFWVNALWVGIFWWFPRAALAGLLALALLLIPYQVRLLDRLTRLNIEMVRLVDSRLRLRADSKPIPRTLDDYTFSDPGLRRFIYRYDVDEGGREFSVYFFVIQPGITHSYSSKTGWFYYPD